jgi:hypothetical protein
MSARKLDFESFTKMMPKNHQKMALFDIFEIVDLEKFSKRTEKCPSFPQKIEQICCIFLGKLGHFLLFF